MERPNRMNNFVQSKTEVREKIEESLRPLCMVEDLNGDEVMELFASIGSRFGLREGFAVDLTTARANGTMWDFS